MLTLLALLLWQPLQPPTRWPIESLAVEGNVRYSAPDILAAAGLKTGVPAGKVELEAARQRLMATGHFGAAGFRFKPSASGIGIAATLEVVEFDELYPVHFERLDAPPAELLDLLRRADPLFRDTIPASLALLDRYAKTIQSHLKIAVAGRQDLDSANQWAVVFSPVAPPPVIAQVRFIGSSVIPAEALQTAIAGVAVGVRYTESGFRKLLDSSIRPLYDARGRLRAGFPELEVEKAQSSEGVLVTVTVDEGPLYTMGEVRFVSDGLPEAELRKAAAIPDFADLEAGLERIAQRVRRSGYLKPDSQVERVLNDETKKADIRIQVDHGPRYHFGKLTIEGLDLISEPEIRRLWALKPGDPFDAGYPDYFLSRLREDGVFDNLGKTKSTAKLDDATHTVDVTLTFLKNGSA